jgi:acetyltransferase-like isoleucine patch superfamily enzyme
MTRMWVFVRRLFRRGGIRVVVFVAWLLDPAIEVVGRYRKEHPRIYGDRSRVQISPLARVNDAVLNTNSGRIVVEDDAFFGHQVMIVTGRHDVDRFGVDRKQAVPLEGCDVTVRRGAWVSSRALILGPCEIGEHAVVAAGSVVTHSVAAYTIVAGVPARVVATIQPPNGASTPSVDRGS